MVLYTPKGEIIFQHREKDKDTYPDLLDATVGGHVEIGSDYENSAFQELEEETGIKATKDNFAFIQMIRSKTYS
ncbi:NUDIX domain-containing protein [Patescibacteria group bacterium]|nr:NUDIX domain-containing protein [Patescibacteria group bacterium]MBU1870987.1 NUDIX domain-containing protein [Patescibacteria group bacterium]